MHHAHVPQICFNCHCIWELFCKNCCLEWVCFQVWIWVFFLFFIFFFPFWYGHRKERDIEFSLHYIYPDVYKSLSNDGLDLHKMKLEEFPLNYSFRSFSLWLYCSDRKLYLLLFRMHPQKRQLICRMTEWKERTVTNPSMFVLFFITKWNNLTHSGLTQWFILCSAIWVVFCSSC